MEAPPGFALAKGKNDDEGSTVFTHTLLFGVCFAILFLLLGLFGAAPLTSLLGADQTVFEMTKTYLRVLLLFSPAFLLNDIMLCFVLQRWCAASGDGGHGGRQLI